MPRQAIVRGCETEAAASVAAKATKGPAARPSAAPSGVSQASAQARILEGTVTDPEGRGVEGVTLTAKFARTGMSRYPHHLGLETCRTDSAGRFRVGVPMYGEWAMLRIDAPGWVQPPPRTVRPDGTEYGDRTPVDARALHLARGNGWPSQRIVLQHGQPVEGVVESAECIPLPDVPVEAAWGEGPAARAAGRTDDHGRFTITVPRAVVLVARTGEENLSPLPPAFREPRFHGEARAGPVAPGSSGLRMVLRETVPLNLCVRGPEGPLTGNAIVRIRDVTRPGDVLEHDLHVREGELQYEPPRLLPGIYEIEVVPEDKESLQTRVRVTVPGAPVDVLCPRSSSIDCFLEGEDLKHFEITWSGPCDESRRTIGVSSAEFAFRGIGVGIGDVYARREGDPRCALVAACRPGAGVVRLTLAEGLTIRGRVEGLERLDPSWLTARAVRGALDQHAPVGPDGTFAIVGLPQGSFRVELVTRRWLRTGLVVSWLHDDRDDVVTGAEDVVLRVRLLATEPENDGS